MILNRRTAKIIPKKTKIEKDKNLIIEKIKLLFEDPAYQDEEEKIKVLNDIRKELHKYSPFKNEPVDFVLWVKSNNVVANDYNPNRVAPPEMKLLERSIDEDGFTQPIVTWINNGKHEVVDGFHRNRVGKENVTIKQRILEYLPVTEIKSNPNDRNSRIASTIRHNRARGRHTVDGMSDIIIELKNRNWTNSRIGKELGMDEDEILRLCQITGLAGLFSDQEFSKSWDVEGEIDESDFQELSDDIKTYGDEINEFRTINTSDENRIFHKWNKWECYKAGFYNVTKPGMTKNECEQAYCDFLSNTKHFSGALKRVIIEWKYSCEHYLTNIAMNRIAWLGQAAICYTYEIPSAFRGGFFLLTVEQQEEANKIALTYLNKWLKANDRPEVTMDEALANRQSDIY